MPERSADQRSPKKASLNVEAIHGEAGTGYESPDGKGPFECGNCSYFDSDESSCSQEDMKAKSKRKRLKNGDVSVEEDGCCEFVDRTGKDEDEEED